MTHLFDHRLETLVMVATTGSFTAAAQALYISQPAVSQQIRSLEIDLRLDLVVRQGKNVQLTPAARELVAYLRHQQVHHEQLLTKLRQEERGPLRLGATLSLSQLLLPPLLHRALKDGWQVNSQVANTGQLLTLIEKGSLDVALIEGNFNKKDFGTIELGTVPFVPVGGTDLPTTMTWEEVFHQPLLVREEGSGTRAILTAWLASHNYSLADFEQVITLNNPTTIINLLKEGSGVSFMYRDLVADDIAQCRLQDLNLPRFAVAHPLNLVYLKGSVRIKDYQRIAQILQQALGKQGQN